MADWITKALSEVLKTDFSDELSTYIMSIKTTGELEDFLGSILDLKRGDHKRVFDNIKSLKFGTTKTQSDVDIAKSKPSNSKSVDEIKPSSFGVGLQEPKAKVKTTKRHVQLHINQLQSGKLVEGRVYCECMAQRHELINNCLNCGRIVCVQEGSGPCYFCGELVCTPEETAMLSTETKTADQLFRTLQGRKFKEALELRDRLVDYDRNSASRMKVIDDDKDYYDMNSQWLTPAEKEKRLKVMDANYQRRHGSKLGPRKITLDFSEKKIVEEEPFVEEVVEFEREPEVYVAKQKQIIQLLKKSAELTIQKKEPEHEEVEDLRGPDELDVIESATVMFQSDRGYCLTMHQPWASLLVHGIKKHEGRTWYTVHRGPLWIHAAAKVPTADEIKTAQDFYTDYHQGEKLDFPRHYPTSCLLGNVMVMEVMEHEEYAVVHPDGESNSPYVFICEEPQVLPVPIPMRGRDHIYKLTRKVHFAARDALTFVKKNYSWDD